ncbi:MAG: secondary thiamine-phosphate synthase enzyme YjbQ [Planctomycetota bacterium]|nr:secondary thiamine-phosphate synthase enzyme YjbQ [Planctomycetota bacterium]
MLFQESITVATSGRGTYDVTRDVAQAVADSGIEHGLCTLFIHHTSASLIVCENADPTVRSDLEAWLARAVPDGDPMFEHDAEGPDDMPAHVRSTLTQTSLGVPVRGGRLDLGTWQGIYLYEHRLGGHRRRMSLTLVGEPPDS